MVIKDKEIFNKCLIKLNSKTLKEDENYKQNVDTDSVADSVESNDALDDYKDETIEEEDEKEKVLADKINVVKVKDIEETNGRNSNTLVKIDNYVVNSKNSINIIPSQALHLKAPFITMT